MDGLSGTGGWPWWTAGMQASREKAVKDRQLGDDEQERKVWNGMEGTEVVLYPGTQVSFGAFRKEPARCNVGRDGIAWAHLESAVGIV